jgi:BirA family transcriptional regulator, biotin operon repressor / biotin---[acetyl-CoA-carboxylase] ligase
VTTSKSGFSLTRLRAGLKPFRLYWFGRLRSTNDHAARLRRTGKLYAPAVVLTAHQSAGRGRGKNSWWSGKGGAAGEVLTATFALPIQERLAPQELPLIAGLAVRQAAVELTGSQNIQLKWPNDVMSDGLKFAGILCERVSNVDLVGIGMNVNLDPRRAPVSLREQITSLFGIGGKRLDMTDVLLAVARHLGQLVRRRMDQPFAVFARQFERYDALAGKRVLIVPPAGEKPIDGRCEGIDSSGRLLVRRRGTLHKIVAGHVMIGGPS